MAYLALLEDAANGRIWRDGLFFRDHQDMLTSDDKWLMSLFQLPRAVLLNLCAVLGPALLQSHFQGLTTSRFLVTGTFQRELADGSGISQPTFSRVMPDLLGGITGLTHKYIQFPYTVVEQANIKVRFAAMFSLPNVIEAIDCTHVAIRVRVRMT